MTHQAAAVRADLLDIVFANRNRAYGAYQLRRSYPDTLARALGGGFFLIVAFFAAVHLLAARKSAKTDSNDGALICIFDRKPTLESKPLPKPVLSKSAAPARRTIAFTPPIIAPDENLPEETDPSTQEDLALTNAEVGAQNQDGSTEGPPDLTDLILPGTGNGTGTGGDDDTVYDMGGVHKPPYFPGGEKELLAYISRNIKYPAAARDAGITGPVVVSFVVNTDGSTSDITVLKDPGGGCGKEVVRVMNSMPNWVPGESNGHLVRVRFYLPVRFELD